MLPQNQTIIIKYGYKNVTVSATITFMIVIINYSVNSRKELGVVTQYKTQTTKLYTEQWDSDDGLSNCRNTNTTIH